MYFVVVTHCTTFFSSLRDFDVCKVSNSSATLSNSYIPVTSYGICRVLILTSAIEGVDIKRYTIQLVVGRYAIDLETPSNCGISVTINIWAKDSVSICYAEVFPSV